MKKMKLAILAVLGMVFLISCSNDEVTEQGTSERVIPTKSDNIDGLIAYNKTILNLSTEIKKRGNTLTEAQATSLLQPALLQSRTVLNQEGFSDAALIEEFGSLKSPEMIKFGIIIAQTQTFHHHGITWDLVTDCFRDAAGLGIVTELIRYGVKEMLIRMGTKAVIQAAGKILSKYAGFLGAAVMVADFAECMITGD